jgi:hypothetical protein
MKGRHIKPTNPSHMTDLIQNNKNGSHWPCNISALGRRAWMVLVLKVVRMSRDPNATADFRGIPDTDAWRTGEMRTEY